MTIKQQLTIQLQKILKELAILDIEPKVEYPADPKHGDYSSNVALVAAKKLKRNPLELAEEIKQKLGVRNPSNSVGRQELGLIDRIEVVTPGFINFWITNKALAKNVDEEKNEGAFTRKKIMVEFTDPNPFKEFHIGHLYSNIVGESISRLLESQGAEVWRVCYQGDVGLHVAKALWGMIQLKEQMPEETPDNYAERAAFMGKAYTLGATAYEDNEETKKEITELNKKIYQRHESIIELYEKGKHWSLDYFYQIYQRLGTEFKKFYFESEVGEYGTKYVKEHIGKVFKESNGAIVFPGEDYGLHTRVFINSQGLPTYEAKELGLAPTKYKDFTYDESIIITGNEINEYFKVLLKALSLINPDLAAKTIHISHGMVRLPGGKMSSRKGIQRELTGMFFIEDAKREVGMKKMGLTSAEVSSSKEAEIVGIGAVKYALLKSNIGSDIIFNLEESISFEGNSGPYLQYSFVRTHSILDNAKKSGIALRHLNEIVIPESLELEERELLRLLSHFPEIVTEAASRFAPHILCTYLFDLAQAFNLFYQKCPILKAEEQVREFRLFVTQKTGETLKQGLSLLGIQAPEKM